MAIIKLTRLFTLTSLFFSVLVSADTTLPNFFSSNMIIQQSKQVAFWGFDRANQTVEITTTWGEKHHVKTEKNGKWQVTLSTPAADFKHHNIHVKGSSNVILNDVMLGELWFASGQSNMEMRVSGSMNQPILNSNDVILTSNNDYIRMFYASNASSDVVEKNIAGQWLSASPSTTGDFSAVGYFFALKLQQVLNVPVGIVQSSWGGSPVEPWIPAETLAKFSGYSYETELIASEQPPQKRPSHLYNAMIHPFLGLTVQGVLWYQGESNWQQPKEYQTLFPAMIESWRTNWQQPNLPFYFVQIAPKHHQEGNSAYLREAQLLTMQKVKNTGMAVLLDVGECYQIHPSNKQAVGERLAYWAFNHQYGYKKIATSGPVYKTIQKNEQGKITLAFDYAERGLTSFQQPLTGFEIAGSNKKFYPAKAKIDFRKPTVTVWSEKVSKPVAVRYAFENCPNASLYNTQGLPASSFRTDSW